MTREEAIKAFTMRYDGFSYQSIADELHYTKSHISYELNAICHRTMCIRYRILYSRIIHDFGSIYKFAQEKGLYAEAVRRFFRTPTKPSQRVILAVLKTYPENTYSELLSDDDFAED